MTEITPRGRVFTRKREISLIDRRLTDAERQELAELNARISYVLNEDCTCAACQLEPPGNCKPHETLTCPCPCHGDDGALAIDGIIWERTPT